MRALPTVIAASLLAACQTSLPVDPTPALSSIEKLDSLRREFAVVQITNEVLGRNVAVILPDGRRNQPTSSLSNAIDQVFALVTGGH